jgi:glycosyltransferase involved in cell wall biosynthesis
MAAMSKAPVASVVVATHNRAHLLDRLIRALEQQAGVGPFEIFIVDDASTDDTWSVLQRLSTTTRLPLTPLRLAANAGPATARNAGWRAARAPAVVFTDDDCVPQPGWLASLLRGLSTAELVQGRTIAMPERESGRGPFARSLWVHEESGLYETCNMAYRRSVLERVGGFDEGFALPFGEDIDLGWRAKEGGARSSFDRDALVHHDVFPSRYLAYVRDKKRRAGLVRAISRHPGIRDQLHSRYFYEASHPRALLAALGIVIGLVRRKPAGWLVALLFLVPYARYRTIDEPLPCRRKNLAPVMVLALVADLVEIGVIVRSSIRYRTFLL